MSSRPRASGSASSTPRPTAASSIRSSLTLALGRRPEQHPSSGTPSGPSTRPFHASPQKLAWQPETLEKIKQPNPEGALAGRARSASPGCPGLDRPDGDQVRTDGQGHGGTVEHQVVHRRVAGVPVVEAAEVQRADTIGLRLAASGFGLADPLDPRRPTDP